MSATEMRIVIAILGVLVLGLIYWFGNPARREQGRRRERGQERRVEPILGEDDDVDAADEPGRVPPSEPVQSEMDIGDLPVADTDPGEPHSRTIQYPPPDRPGQRRGSAAPERIVSLLVVARQDDQVFHGPDIVVAAEKAGLAFGHMDIFHRLLDGKSELGPVFSVANMVKPGAFDMAAVRELETPGLNLFMQLPGPMPALDAWDTMLPTARRLAELLDGRVVDDQHNALGRQRVAYIRDDLRAWDRKHEL